MYFVGNPNGRGHQLFRFDGKVIGQVTNFAESYYDSDAKDKEKKSHSARGKHPTCGSLR
jgi:hypothetical protein